MNKRWLDVEYHRWLGIILEINVHLASVSIALVGEDVSKLWKRNSDVMTRKKANMYFLNNVEFVKPKERQQPLVNI